MKKILSIILFFILILQQSAWAAKTKSGKSEQRMQQIEQLKAQKGSTATDYVSLIEEIMPSIVLIETGLGFGSGFFVDSYGDILTNYHIVKNALKILVTTQNNGRVNAQLKNYDDKRDIALLTIQLDEPTTFLRISNTLPKQGEKILATRIRSSKTFERLSSLTK